MRKLTFIEAVREALREEMLRDKTVFLIGEDVARGVFGVTQGLINEFGEERVIDTPISENSIIGAALGAAMTGMRPVAEVMFSDFLTLCMDQLVNQAAKIRYVSGGQVKVPLVVRTLIGLGRSAGPQHSQSIISWFVHVPGLKVVVPSTPYDAKGLLKTAIRDDNPVLYFETNLLYGTRGPIPEEEYTIPLGQADIKREGDDFTVVAISFMVQRALAAAKKLEEEGTSVEVVDPRTLVPLDRKTILDSVKKTGRLVIAEGDCKRGGVGAEIASIVIEEAFDYLDAPIRRVASFDSPIPCSPPLERWIMPGEDDIIRAIKETTS